MSRDRFSQEKYYRFHDRLKPDIQFYWIEGPGRFPISSSSKSFSADDYVGGESANGALHDFLLDLQNNPGKDFMDIGCGMREEIYENCLYIEVYPSVCADLIVRPDCRYPLNDCSFDRISCGSVLEHVTQPWAVIDEIHRILKPGGRCYIDWSFRAPVHGAPSHYYNATREGLRIFFADRFNIDRLDSHQAPTPEFSLYWLLERFAAEISDPRLNEQFRKMSIDQLLAHPPSEAAFWKPILKTLSKSAGGEFACGNYLIATKN